MAVITQSAAIFATVLLVLLMVLAPGTLASESTDEHTPLVFVHKTVPQFDAVVDTNLTFTITIYNNGKNTVYDVNVQDNDWPSEFFVTDEGANKAHFDAIEPGAHVTYSYSIAPQNIGEITTTPARVTFYTSPPSSEGGVEAQVQREYVVRSTDLPVIPVLTAAQFNKKYNSHLDEWVIFGLLSVAAVGLPYLVYLYSNNKIQELRH